MITTYFILLLAPCFPSEVLHSQPQARVIGGSNFQIGKAPWQVSIQVHGNHHCGGSIFSNRIIITAAHCFYRQKSDHEPYRLLEDREFLVVAGSPFTGSRETLAAVSAKKHHEYYIKSPNFYDIGIMKLFQTLPTNNLVRPIPLALQSPAPGSEVLATGWGTFIMGDPANPEVLQGLNSIIINKDYCNYYFPNVKLGNEHICFGYPGQTSCFGDSGGPLVFQKTLVGVTSFGTRTCSGPSVYASVAFFHGWLMNAIKTI